MTATAEVTAIATRQQQDYSREQIDLIKQTICVGATDNELALFVQTAKRMQLDPFARQIFAVKRWNRQANREVMSTQVSIDGFRLVAERTGKYAGQLGPFWTADGKEWVDVWLDSKPPRAAKVGVLRHDFKEPVWAVATWEEYKQESRNGLSPMWQKMGPLMLAKCAESLGLRRAFPNELSGVYSDAEMAQATTVEVIDPEQNAAIRAAVDQEPPRPKARAAGADALVQTSTSPASAIPTASPGNATAKAPRANTVKHDGTFASHKQVALLHMMRSKVGGLDVCDKEPCYDKDGKRINPVRGMCAYHKQLAAFKDCDGRPITTSTNLSEAQISNLIDRYEKKIAEQAKRAEQVPDIGALDTAKPEDLATDAEVDELSKAISGHEDTEALAELLCNTLHVMTVGDIRSKRQVSAALAIVMAYGTKALDTIIERLSK